MTKKIKVPCHNCEKREFRCHGKCKEYDEYVQQNNERRAALRAEREKQDFRNDVGLKVRKQYIRATHRGAGLNDQ